MHEDDYFILVAHPSDQSILVHDDERLNLPILHFTEPSLTELQQVCGLVKRMLQPSFDVIRLRSECEALNTTSYLWRLLIFEIPDTDTPEPPHGYKWFPREQCSKVCVQPHIDEVVRYLSEYERIGLEINGDRLRPYSRPGWFRLICNRITAFLQLHYQYEVDNILQLRSDGESCIIQAITRNGPKFYLKATGEGAWNEEISVTQTLGRQMPAYFETPLLIDEEERLMLMKDYGPTLPDRGPNSNVDPLFITRVLVQWGQIQKNSIPLLDSLKRGGVPIRDCTYMKLRAREMVEDLRWFTMQQRQIARMAKTCSNRAYLSVYESWEQTAYASEYLKFLNRLDEKLCSYKVPNSLVHGDLNEVNTIPMQDGSYKFIDFAYTEISHPFIDALDCANNDISNIYAYLSLWEEYEPIERLQELMGIVKMLSFVKASVVAYLAFLADEGDRRQSELELGSPVCITFEVYKD